jgi:uncharacterized protein with von Willebrand factor type A (vWA) domain
MTMPGTDAFSREGNALSVREQVRGLKDQAIDQGRSSLRDARDRAASSLGESKGRVAEQIVAVAQAFRQAADQLRNQGQGQQISGLTDAMARRADQVADYLRRANADVVRQDAERLTRSQPALVLGGAFIAGLIGARFLKASERLHQEDSLRYDADPVNRAPGSKASGGLAPEYGSESTGFTPGSSGYLPEGFGGSTGGGDGGS